MFVFRTQLRLSFSMPKHAGKIPFDAVEAHASDGYYVFIALLSVVATTTLAVLVSLGIKMLG